MLLLLVEDERRLSEALSHLLEKQGYSVDVAADGETGLDMAATGVYDLLILTARDAPPRPGVRAVRAEDRSQSLVSPASSETRGLSGAALISASSAPMRCMNEDGAVVSRTISRDGR